MGSSDPKSLMISETFGDKIILFPNFGDIAQDADQASRQGNDGLQDRGPHRVQHLRTGSHSNPTDIFISLVFFIFLLSLPLFYCTSSLPPLSDFFLQQDFSQGRRDLNLPPAGVQPSFQFRNLRPRRPLSFCLCSKEGSTLPQPSTLLPTSFFWMPDAKMRSRC